MKIHELKCWPELFTPVIKKKKPFDVRLNDRDYQAGDALLLSEYNPLQKTYTGRQALVIVDQVFELAVPGLKKGFVIMAITVASVNGFYTMEVPPDGKK